MGLAPLCPPYSLPPEAPIIERTALGAILWLPNWPCVYRKWRSGWVVVIGSNGGSGSLAVQTDLIVNVPTSVISISLVLSPILPEASTVEDY